MVSVIEREEMQMSCSSCTRAYQSYKKNNVCPANGILKSDLKQILFYCFFKI